MNESCNTVKIAQETGDTLEEVYTDQIFCCIDEFCAKGGIDDLPAASQSKWNAMLLYIFNCVFKEDSSRLKRQPYTDYTKETGARQNFRLGSNNAYDFSKVREVAKVYTYCCFLYEKECSIFGFSLMTGISRETLYTWKNDPNSGGSDIVKNIIASREETLSDKLYSSKTNPVGTIAILNHAYGWSTNRTSIEIKTTTQSIEEIEKKYLPSVEQAETETTMPGDDQGLLDFD